MNVGGQLAGLLDLMRYSVSLIVAYAVLGRLLVRSGPYLGIRLVSFLVLCFSLDDIRRFLGYEINGDVLGLLLRRRFSDGARLPRFLTATTIPIL